MIYDSASINAQNACMVKVREDASFSLTPTIGHRFVVARYTWTNAIDTAAVYLSVAAPLPYDVVLCALEWNGVDLATVDSAASGLSDIDRLSLIYNNLRAVPDPANAMVVKVLPGQTYVATKRLNYAGGTLTIPTAVSGVRYDIISLKYDGTLLRTAGVEGDAMPTRSVFGQYAIALVRVRIGCTQILDSDILDIRPFTAGTERMPRHIHILNAITTHNVDISVPGDQYLSIAQANPTDAAPTIVFPSIPDVSYLPLVVEIFNGGAIPVPITNVVDGLGAAVASIAQGRSRRIKATQSSADALIWVADNPDISTAVGVSGTNIAAKKIIRIDSADGSLKLADKAAMANAAVVGVSLQAATTGVPCLFKLFGEIKDFATGLTPGAPVYLHSSGGYTQDATLSGIATGEVKREIGIAINATDIFLCIRDASLANVLIMPTTSSALPNATWIE
jgi:hypothetical protein